MAGAHTHRNIKFKHIVPVPVWVLARSGGFHAWGGGRVALPERKRSK